MKICTIASWFNQFKAQYVPRLCNRAADRLTHLTKDHETIEWIEVALDCIVEVLAEDIASE